MSTSKTSIASVKSPHHNSSNSFGTQKTYDSDFKYRFCGVKCKCNLTSPCQEAWKEGTFDPGRRFFGCPQYKDPSRRCNFFLWADPPYSDRAREVIGDLRMKLRRKEDEDVKFDLHFAERKMLVLNEECITLRKKNEEAAELLKKKEKEVCTMKRLLVIVVVTWMFCILFK